MGKITRHYDPARRPGDSLILEQAINDRVIGPILKNGPLVERLNKFDSFRDLARPTMSELEDPAQQDAAANYIDNTRGRVDNGGVSWPLNTIKELARITVPSRQMGIVRKVETYAEGEHSEPLTNTDNFGSPFVSDDFIWILRLSCDNVSGLGNWYDSQFERNVPGIPFRQLGRWNDLRYGWGNAADRTFLLVPGGHTLRLFCMFKRVSRSFAIAGRLVGTIQGSNHISAAWNARRGWTS